MLLDTADLPCIPMHTGHGISALYGVMLSVLQTIGEHDYTEVAKALLDSVVRAMSRVHVLWNGDRTWSDIGEHLAPLRGLVVRLANLNDYYNNLPATQHRVGTSLLQVVNAASDGNFLRDVGQFHRTTMFVASSLKVVEDGESERPVEDPKGSATKYLSSRLYTGFTKISKGMSCVRPPINYCPVLNPQLSFVYFSTSDLSKRLTEKKRKLLPNLSPKTCSTMQITARLSTVRSQWSTIQSLWDP